MLIKPVLIFFSVCFSSVLMAQGGLSPLPLSKNGFIVIAHRGNHIQVPENTVASVKEAIRCGADYVELDLRTSKDGYLVLSHDASVDRMTDGRGKIKDLTLREIKKLTITGHASAGDHNTYRVPEFKEVLAACRKRMNIYLDFKDADPQETYRQLKAAGMEKHVVVYLNKAEQYGQWKKAAPDMPLMSSLPEEIKTPDEFQAYLLRKPVEVLDNVTDPVMLAAAREKGIAVWLDVEDENENPVLWNNVIDKGVQGMQTDHPGDLVSYLKQTGRRNGRAVSETGNSAAITRITYAERLGFPQKAKVIIFHVDDAGMSVNSNEGAINSIEKGVATSTSIMMPCPWAAGFAKYAVKKNYDAGLHLTLNSEWNHYRWAPLAGVKQVPGLVDPEWCLWPEAEDVVKHASADEVETEIRAQLARALSLGLHPTHLDSHMGTLFARKDYLERYIKVGVENGIPVMFPGGNDKLLIANLNEPLIKQLKAAGLWKEGTILPLPDIMKGADSVGAMIWNAGLPVLDDLVTYSGEWKPEPVNGVVTPEAYAKYKVKKLEETIEDMQPGVAMFIVHSTVVTDDFRHISASGDSRNADMLAMMDPGFKTWLQQNGIILTTWRELMQRRRQVK